jgi:death-on-curing protein
MFYLCRNHPFVDGNKRTGLAACLVFLSRNGLLRDPGLPVRGIDAWEAWVLDVAASRIDRDETTLRLRGLLDPKPAPRKPRRKVASRTRR